MSKIVSIRENGELKQFITSKIKTLLQDGEYAYWIPEDEIDVVDKYITQNGVYSAADEGHHGYSRVTVEVESSGGVLHGTVPPTSDLGQDGYVYLQWDLDEDETETPDEITALGYKYVGHIATESAGPYVNIGPLGLTATGARETLKLEFSCDTTLGVSGGLFGTNATGDTDLHLTAGSGNIVSSLEGQTVAVSASESGSDSIETGTYHNGIALSVLSSTMNVVLSPETAFPTSDVYLMGVNGGALSSNFKVYLLTVKTTTLDSSGSSGAMEIIKIFHPAKRLSDGELGFYESRSNTFYPNVGTGEFVAPHEGTGEITNVYYKQNGAWEEIVGGNIPDAGGHYFGTVSGSTSGSSETGGSSETSTTSGDEGSSSGGSTSGSGSSSTGGSSSTSGSESQETTTVEEILVYKDGTKYEDLSYQNWPNNSGDERIFEDSDKIRFLIDSTSADGEISDYYRLWVWSTNKYDVTNYTSAYLKYAVNGTVYEQTLDISSISGARQIAVYLIYSLALDAEVNGTTVHIPETCEATFYIHDEDDPYATSADATLVDTEDNSPTSFYIYEMRIDP